MLLLAAAALKLGGQDVSAVPQVGWFSAPWLQMAAAAWEVALGLWLMSGAARPWAWSAALATFAAFAVVSGYLGWQGVASCGCFGSIEASPWHAFTVDVLAMATLAAFRPAIDCTVMQETFYRTGTLLAGTAALLGFAAVGGTAAYGSVGAALAHLRGESLVSPDYLDFGTTRPGDRIARSASITNYSGEPIRLIGGTSDCSCVTTTDLPLTIPPGGTVDFRVLMEIPAATTTGRLTRTAEVATNCAQRRIIRLRLGAHVGASGDPTTR